MHPSRLAHRLLAVAIASAVSLLPNATALANHQANCSDFGFVSRTYGYLSDSWANHRYGVRGTFENQGHNLCLNPRPGEGSSSTIWVAIQGPPHPYNIVQMGHGKCRPIAGGGCNENMQDGYAWGRHSSAPGCSGFASKPPTGVWLGVWSGGGVYTVIEQGDHDYVLTGPSTQTTIGNASICWTNDSVATFGENHDWGDPIGGSAGNHFRISNRQFRTEAGGAWMALPTQCNGGNAPDPPFRCANENGALALWTAR